MKAAAKADNWCGFIWCRGKPRPFKESWMAIGCSWIRCSQFPAQVNLMRVSEGEREGTWGYGIAANVGWCNCPGVNLEEGTGCQADSLPHLVL